MAGESISIVVLTYNRKKLLKDCLDSLIEQTATGDGIEILVADDGSTDGTRDLVASYSHSHPNIRWLHHRHSGISATRNLGIKAARGDFIAIVADDYILDPGYVRVILDFFRNYPDAGVVRFKIIASRSDLGSRISHFYYDSSMRGRLYKQSVADSRTWSESLRAVFTEPPSQKEELTCEHELEASGAAAFRRRIFDEVGLFDEAFQRAEDSDFTVRLRSRGIKVYYYPHLSVQHQYEPFMMDTIRKSFESGRSRYQYFRKHSMTPRVFDDSFRSTLMLKLGTLINAIRHIKTPGQFVTHLPCLVVFEGANKLGYLSASIFSGRRLVRSDRPSSR